MRTQFLKILKEIEHRGVDVFNDFFPPIENSDVYSERVKSFLMFISGFSLLMMITSPYGWLYACMLRPIYANFLRLHGMVINAPHPESGLHYSTLFIYTLLAYISIVKMEREGINRPFQKISYVFLLTIASLYIPFEIVYITLYDYFHNLPTHGYWAIWSYGWWRPLWKRIFWSVIASDVGIPIICFIGMYLLKKSLDEFYPTKIKFDKVSLILLSGYIILTIGWVLLPLYYPNTHPYGSKWFPQTVYVKYGYFDKPLPNGDIYGIVEEYWFPDDVIKYFNTFSKWFSASFMFYTFTLRRVKKCESKT